MQTKNIFITGATGFLGRELVKRLLLQKEDCRLYLLIRCGKNETAQKRFSKYLNRLSLELNLPIKYLFERLRLVAGQLETVQFGLSDQAFKNLAVKINTVFHAAASVHLHDTLENLHKVNFNGTQEVLKLAELALQYKGFEGLHYISTAYVSGKRKGIIYEEELEAGQSFICNYEKVKFDAEVLVEKSKSQLPVTIYRPSMIVGDSNTGKTCAFNVIYEPLKMMLKGKLPFWSADKNAVIDVVPVNYVCDALLLLASKPEQTLGKTFHLTVGKDKEISSKVFLNKSYQYLNNYVNNPISKPVIIPPFGLKGLAKVMHVLGDRKRRKIAKHWLTFANYTTYHKSFDNTQVTSILKPAGIVAPPLQNYLSVLCDYAMTHHFGKQYLKSGNELEPKVILA